MKQKGGVPYGLVPRTKRKDNGEPLSWRAYDITIRINKDGACFLQDHNSDRLAMPHNNLDELFETLHEELETHYQELFTRR